MSNADNQEPRLALSWIREGHPLCLPPHLLRSDIETTRIKFGTNRLLTTKLTICFLSNRIKFDI